MSKKIIEIKNLSKKYFIGTYDFRLLKTLFFSNNEAKKKLALMNNLLVLKNLNLEIKKGENTAIIGKNGTGKSTLCKIMAGVTEPDEGQISIDGKIIPMLNLHYGIELECTGIENIYFLASSFGFSKRETDQLIPEILNFSDMERYKDTPLKKYSSGMFTRLVFSTLVHLDGDIILADEILAVSDQDFKTKCIKKFKELNEKGKTLICISHEQEIISSICEKAYVFTDTGILSNKLDIKQAYEMYNNLTN